MARGLTSFKSRSGYEAAARVYVIGKPCIRNEGEKLLGIESPAGPDKSSLRFHRHENVRDGLGRVCNELIERACARIVRPGRDRTEDLHRVRVTIKRLRALLRLIRPVISRTIFEEENERLKKAARRLSPYRDAAVFRKTLKDLAPPRCDRKTRKAFDLVLRDMSPRREVRSRFCMAREHGMQSALKDLKNAAGSIRDLLIAAEDWPAIEAGLRREYRITRNWMSRSLSRDDDDEFHAWRIRTKYLFYQLQIIEPAWPTHLARMIKRLKRLEDRLGADHDLIVLKRLLVSTPEEHGGRQAVKTVMRLLRRRSQRLRKNCATLGRSLLSEKPSRFISRLERHWREWRVTS
jgi:CHAD domain-containing protein